MDKGEIKKKLRGFSLIHMALLVSVAMFGGIVFLMYSTGILEPSKDESFVKILGGVLLLVSTLAIVAGQVLLKKKRQLQIEGTNLVSKLDKLLPLLITVWALAEAPALFSVVVFLLTGQKIIFALTMVLLIYLYYLMPNPDLYMKYIKLSDEEIDALY